MLCDAIWMCVHLHCPLFRWWSIWLTKCCLRVTLPTTCERCQVNTKTLNTLWVYREAKVKENGMCQPDEKLIRQNRREHLIRNRNICSTHRLGTGFDAAPFKSVMCLCVSGHGSVQRPAASEAAQTLPASPPPSESRQQRSWRYRRAQV